MRRELTLLPSSLQDEQSAMLMLKRHTVLKQAVDDYADSIRKLSDRAQRMFTEEHPHGLVLTATQPSTNHRIHSFIQTF